MKKIYFLLIASLLSLISIELKAEVHYIYHQQTMTNPGCGPNYVSSISPNNNQAMNLAWKIEYQFFTTNTVVYYTTDGSNPSGSFGTGSGTTQVVAGTYNCTFSSGGTVDVAIATIPAQAAGTTVKYIISAWHSGGGNEIFANGPGAPCSCGPLTDNSSLATVFSYSVVPDCSGLAAGTISGPATPCLGDAALLTATGTSTGTNFSHQWFNSSSATGPWTSISGANALTYSPPTTASGISYYQLATTCGSNTVTTDYSVDVLPLPTLTVTSNSPVCMGGTISLNAATNAASVAWTGPNTFTSSMTSPSIANATMNEAGSYSVVALGINGCTTTGNTVVNIFANPTVSITPTHALCFDGTGSAQALATGSTAPYSYAWNNGGMTDLITGIPAGVYSVQVTDANGCTSTSETVVTSPTALVLSANTFGTSCSPGSDGIVIGSTQGGIPSYFYSINGSSTQASPTFNNLNAGTYTVTVMDNNGCTATTLATVSAASLTLNSLTTTAPKVCPVILGSIDISVTGGTNPIYAIMPMTGMQSSPGSFTGLVGGDYTISATSGSCNYSTVVSLTNLPSFGFGMITTTSPLCHGSNGGSITVTTQNAASQVTYSSSPILTQGNPGIFTSAVANTYIISASDGQCTTTTAVTITQPASMMISNILTSPACNGAATGMITSSASGGAGGYTYALIPANGIQPVPGTFGNLPSAIYQVKVTDVNGCTKTGLLVLPQPSQVKFLSVARTHPVCNGASTGSIAAVTSGGSGAKTLSILPMGSMLNALNAGAYTLVATDANGCTKTSSTTITQPSAISWTSVVTTPAINGPNGAIAVSAVGGTGSKTYSLNPITGTQTGGTFTGLANGTYTVTATDSKSCTMSTTVTLTPPLNIVLETNEFYPNPTQGIVQLGTNIGVNDLVLVYDTKGHLLNKGIGLSQVDLTTYPSGYYLIRVENAELKRQALIQKQ